MNRFLWVRTSGRLFLELPAGLLVHEVVSPPVALQRGRSQVLREPNPGDGVLDKLVLKLLPERCVLAHKGDVRLDKGDDPIIEPLDGSIVLYSAERKIQDRLLVLADHHRDDFLGAFQPDMVDVLVREHFEA